MTERLYYQDPYLRAFQAHVIERRQIEGRLAVVLDATAFYPAGGGQPADAGTLNGVRVVDVQAAEDGEILHFLDGPLAENAVHGELDWDRRFDHMQQHTGQHVLSQAFVQLHDAETVSFHLGEAVSTVDLDRAPVNPGEVAAAERLANQVMLDNDAVSARFVEESELAALPLRKPPVVEGPIRVVQIADFDWSACGGTHVLNSGEVGPIKVIRVERRKQETRIHFLCGWRALSDYGQKHEVIQAVANHFTTSESEIVPSVQRLEASVKELQKALADAQAEMLGYQLPCWLKDAEAVGDLRVVRLIFDDRDPAMLKEIARRLTEESGTIALLATRQPRIQFVFARSEHVDVDMGRVMRAACAAVDGRGGGSPQFAQGGAPRDSSPEVAIDAAVELLAGF